MQSAAQTITVVMAYTALASLLSHVALVIVRLPYIARLLLGTIATVLSWMFFTQSVFVEWKQTVVDPHQFILMICGYGSLVMFYAVDWLFWTFRGNMFSSSTEQRG